MNVIISKLVIVFSEVNEKSQKLHIKPVTGNCNVTHFCLFLCVDK